MPPLAHVVASGVSALDPEIIGLGPTMRAAGRLARRAPIDDVDLVEIDDASAAQVGARHA